MKNFVIYLAAMLVIAVTMAALSPDKKTNRMPAKTMKKTPAVKPSPATCKQPATPYVWFGPSLQKEGC